VPIYTPQNTDRFYRIFDANGLEWKYITEVNTDTGEIEQLVKNSEGEFYEGSVGEMARQRRFIPMPISMVPIGSKVIESDA